MVTFHVTTDPQFRANHETGGILVIALSHDHHLVAPDQTARGY